jgi:hypothetical protein
MNPRTCIGTHLYLLAEVSLDQGDVMRRVK